MAPAEQCTAFVNYFLTVYVGYFNVIIGVIGNIINILVFTQLKLFRKNQSAFYLTVASIVDCYQLTFSTLIRVTTATFGFDPTLSSIVWCKLRAYLIQFGSMTSATIICFAAIDQYLSTSCYNRLRQMSTLKLAQRFVGILIIFTNLYCIPVAIFYEIRPNFGCATYNASFNYYYSFIYLCIIIGILPIFISTLFSLLAYQNVRRIIRRQIPIVRRRLDRQLTAMILVRVALFVIATSSFVSIRVYQIYYSVNQNDKYAVAVDQLIRMTIISFSNFNYSGSFYIFMISSNRYRRQVKYLFIKKIWRKCLSMTVNRNRVATDIQLQIVQSHESNVDID